MPRLTSRILSKSAAPIDVTTLGPQRLYLLDAIRGIAAIAVIFWHWQHFYRTTAFYPSTQPLYTALRSLYDYGWMSVELFFCLSGFVFFWLYYEVINTGIVGTREFAVLRVSRLYPLHIITILIMALGQIYRTSHGFPEFVYHNNSFAYFLANLAFVQAWPVNAPESFNGPSWSVSIEIFLYILFFLIVRTIRLKLVFFLAMFFVGLGLMQVHRTMGRGVTEFFMGGLSWYIWSEYLGSRYKRSTSIILIFVTVALWLAAFINIYSHVVTSYFVEICHFLHIHLSNSDTWVGIFLGDIVRFFGLPLTILTLAQLERCNPLRIYKSISKVGDLTYSFYMLHVPLQLTLMTICSDEYLESFRNPLYGMALFFLILVPLSVLSYTYVELPLQKRLRSLLLPHYSIAISSLPKSMVRNDNDNV